MNMKTTFVLLLGLLLLESGVALGQVCAGVQKGVCNANKAIFVIVVDSKNVARGCKCDSLKGQTINEEIAIPKAMNPTGTLNILGTVKKYKLAAETDPCREWVIGGVIRRFCWDEPPT